METQISVTLKEEICKKILQAVEDNNLQYIKTVITQKLDTQYNKAKRLSKRKDRKLAFTLKKEEIMNQAFRKKAEEFRSKLIENQTNAEKICKILLKERGIKYEFQKIFFIGKSFYIVDFYLNDLKSVLELDGKYHIYKLGQKKKDSIRTKELIEAGIKKVIRVSNDTVESPDRRATLFKQLI